MLGDSSGVGVFWKHLPMNQQTMVEDFVSLKIVETNEQHALAADVARVCAQFFEISQEPLVRGLCVQLGYILAEDMAFLGSLRTDVYHDPLELFLPSKSNGQRSRYLTLFAQDVPDNSSLRQLFFRNTVCNAGNGQTLLSVFHSAAQAAVAQHRADQAAILQAVSVAVHHLYEQVRLPNYPDALSHEIAWSTLRCAWADEQYWLSVEELLLVGCHVGPDLQIYTRSLQPDGSGVFELLNRGLLPPVTVPDGFERVLLIMDEEQHCGQHYQRR